MPAPRPASSRIPGRPSTASPRRGHGGTGYRSHDQLSSPAVIGAAARRAAPAVQPWRSRRGRRLPRLVEHRVQDGGSGVGGGCGVRDGHRPGGCVPATGEGDRCEQRHGLRAGRREVGGTAVGAPPQDQRMAPARLVRVRRPSAQRHVHEGVGAGQGSIRRQRQRPHTAAPLTEGRAGTRATRSRCAMPPRPQCREDRTRTFRAPAPRRRVRGLRPRLRARHR
jgi:hypothetical protein